MESSDMAGAPEDGTEAQDAATAAAATPAEPGGADPAGEDTDDGGDVASRDPDAIAHEIEQTRAELADTIDAIADRISPKRAAARSAQAVKAQVSSAKGMVTGDGAATAGPSSGGATGRRELLADSGLPIGPLAAIAGVVLVVLIFLRRRR
jgi:hypothetical protein